MDRFLWSCDQQLTITVISGDDVLDWGQLLGALEYCQKPLSEWQYAPYGSEGKGVSATRKLVLSWMKMIRPTHWNGQEFRCPLPIGESADSYQKTAAAMFLEPKFAILKIWYLSVSAVLGYTILFVLFLLMIAIPVTSNLSYEVSLAEMMKWDAAVSAVIGLLVLTSSIGRNEYYPRCRFRLELGDSSTNTTAIHLSSIIRVIRERKVSEPKDRSYATHGVLRQLGVPLSPVDYSKSIGQIYRELFADLVRWEPGMISLLLDAGGCGAFSDLPSWVPDWNNPNATLLDIKQLVNSELHSKPEHMDHIQVNGSRLTLAPAWTDFITQISPTFRTMDSELFLSNSHHCATWWDQVYYLAQWMSLFCKQAPVEEHESDGASTSEMTSRSVLRKQSYGVEDAYYSITSHQEAHDLLLDEDLSHNWHKLVQVIMPAFAAIGASDLDPAERFETVRRFVRSDPRANLQYWDRGRDESSYRSAVTVMVEIVNKFLVDGRKLFITAHGRPGSILRDVDVREGELVARVEGVYQPLVLRRVSADAEECVVIGNGVIAGEQGFSSGVEAFEGIVLV